MTQSTIALTLGNITIRQQNGLFSLNDLHKAAGGEARHKPSEWLRNQRIARQSRAKLSAEQVQHIRHSNDSHASLARQLHVSAQTVRKIRLGRTYKTYSMQASPFAGLLP